MPSKSGTVPIDSDGPIRIPRHSDGVSRREFRYRSTGRGIPRSLVSDLSNAGASVQS